MQSANLSGPFRGCLYYALLGIPQATGLAGGYDLAVLLQPRFQRSCRNPILPANPHRSQLTGLDHPSHLLFAGLEIRCDLLYREQHHQAHGSSPLF